MVEHAPIDCGHSEPLLYFCGSMMPVIHVLQTACFFCAIHVTPAVTSFPEHVTGKNKGVKDDIFYL